MTEKQNAAALTVYKASAGSGKTFTLATEYIKLLIANPQCFREILAVTFTNKATEEMKRRIMSQLYGIWRGLDDSRSYMNKVCADLGVSPRFASERAGVALHLLLHRYSYFRIQTIDAFFQSVLRNLARELDLTASLRLELNDDQVEAVAVDKMIEQLDAKSPVLQWIMRYIYNNISDDKSWNVIGQIKKFGETIFRDYYKAASKEITQKMGEQGFFERFTQRLRQEKAEATERMTEIAETFFDTIDGEGLTVDDFCRGKSGVAGFFLKIRDGRFDEKIVGNTVANALGDASAWVRKTHPDRQRIMALADEQLIPMLRYAVDERPRQYMRVKSAELATKHLDQLRLLGAIESKVRELNADANRFLLSDTQGMLHSLISDSDTPFIYEKIGSRLSHVMIDEFQDTSTVQWQNFKVLLQECMSHAEAGNLIVGDVKQSIYRWRSGDWRLLNGIESQFPHPGSLLSLKTLGHNYRSRRNIVTFNNLFFARAADEEKKAIDELDTTCGAQIGKAYGDVEQKVPDGRADEGLVEVTVLPAGDDNETETLVRTTATIKRLLNKGVSQNNIAILVRNKRYIPIIANYVVDALGGRVQMVSNEAFRLDASVAVNIIVLALRLLLHRDNSITLATLAKTYQKHVLHSDDGDGTLLLNERDYIKLLPREYSENMDTLVRQPLYELAERLFAIFSLESVPRQSAFVCAFYDYMGQFTDDNFSDIELFLEEWDKKLHAKTICGEDMDGIRIMTIHKSKGLEFDNVIVPFCDWQLEKNYVLWCKADAEPYNELPLIPVDFSRPQMTGTVFEKSYIEEHTQNVVDNLNLLYVAFTRASHNLFVVGALKKKNNNDYRAALLSTVLPTIAAALPTAQLTGQESEEEALEFCFGSLYVPQANSVKPPTANVFLKPSTLLPMTMATYATTATFRQSNKSRDFISGEDEPMQATYIKVGSLLHNVFSTIRTTADIESSLRQLEQEGVIYEDGLTADNVAAMLRKRLADPRVADWFSGRWQLFNECTILSVDETTGLVRERRPDRVMTDGERMIVVDFKFGRERDEYVSQVKEYMALLRSMGYANVTGYLWFVYKNKIVEIA